MHAWPGTARSAAENLNVAGFFRFARTAGAYLCAEPTDPSILDGRDDQKRAELLAERLRRWKSIKSA